MKKIDTVKCYFCMADVQIFNGYYKHDCNHGSFYIDDIYSVVNLLTKYGTFQIRNYFNGFKLDIFPINNRMQNIMSGDCSLSHEDLFKYLKSTERNMVFL